MQLVSALLRGIWQDFNRHDSLLGPSAIAELLVTVVSNFYRAMLCIRGTSHGPVSVSVRVRLSQVGVLLKWLNTGSHKQHHTIAQGL